ncbi:DUF3040 domain-containing protein [Couchioplanes caeruleus]|uniref:DUF3040 domain-containing protein n=1 Tax=Couchioplanes caeruleus TaxID=56438 RepID=UPI0020BFD207|nr:DUF3040 domain-containing protein [Couchioplanes caeruleus]UQU61910.1 DUF3040 domain-containing protein [Couchioplanes caeruleus]
MLSDRDRHALRDIERGLAGEDPGFAARMGGPAGERPLPTILLLSMLLYVTLPMVVFFFGRTGAALTLLLFALAVLLVLVRRQLHAG